MGTYLLESVTLVPLQPSSPVISFVGKRTLCSCTLFVSPVLVGCSNPSHTKKEDKGPRDGSRPCPLDAVSHVSGCQGGGRRSCGWVRAGPGDWFRCIVQEYRGSSYTRMSIHHSSKELLSSVTSHSLNTLVLAPHPHLLSSKGEGGGSRGVTTEKKRAKRRRNGVGLRA